MPQKALLVSERVVAPSLVVLAHVASFSGRRGVERLSACILDCARPDLLDVCDNVLRQRHVAQFLGHFVAFGVGPRKELRCLADSDRVSPGLVFRTDENIVR